MALYDVIEVHVENLDPDVPIEWQPLPHLTWEDSNRRRVRLKDYINNPVSLARFELHPDSELPDGWNLRDNGNLLYNAILGRTVELRFNATRGSESAYSDTLRITRRQAFVTRLIPNRINLGLAFNEANQRVIVYNTTDVGISPVRDFISVFDLDGNEILAESIEVSDHNPAGRSGVAFDGTNYWVCGHGSSHSPANELRVISPAGALLHTYTYSGGEIESVVYDGSAIWGLDIRSAGSRGKLRKFSLSGVENTSAAITLPQAASLQDMTGFYFGAAQYGLAWGDGHFWIIQSHIQGRRYVFCVTTAGVPVPSRHVHIPEAPPCAGCTFNPTTENLWYILDGTDDTGRFGKLEATQI